MKKIFYFIFILLLPLFVQAQQNNCRFGEDAKNHIKRAEKIKESAQHERDFLDAASEFEWVLRENPLCEDIYLALAETYISAGWFNLLHFSTARSYLNKLKTFSSNSAYLSEADDLLYRLSQEERKAAEMYQNKREQDRQLEYERKQEEYRLKEARKREQELIDAYKDYDFFFTIGPGFGQSYGQMGIKGALFMTANGMVFTGGVGYPTHYFNDQSVPLLWSAGGGFSVGTYRTNFQLIAQYYGKIESRKNYYESAVGVIVAGNFDLKRSKFGINVDLGYFLTIESDNIEIYDSRFAELLGLPGIGIPGLGFSVGLYYKF